MRISALSQDLMFSSRVKELLGAAGHEVVFGDDADADVAVVDLFSGWVDKPQRPSLGVYAHTDASMRDRAEVAGYEMIVPRSRFMREGPLLVVRIAGKG